MTLLDDIGVYARPVSFHTPGHKGRLCRADITEIEGSDPFPGGRLAAAEAATAALYGAKALKYLVGGSSAGIKAALLCTKGTVIVPRDAHRSVFDGVRLAGLKIVVIENRFSQGLPLPLSAQEIRRAKIENPDATAVVVQSPDYYGRCANRDDIAEVCQKHSLSLIADSAHGAHFFTRPDLFPPCFSSVAAFTALSAHKTLPAYTQSAYLAVGDVERLSLVEESLAVLGTTSPSYVLLAQLAVAAQEAQRMAGRYDRLLTALMRLKNQVRTLDNDDPMRLVIDAEAAGTAGGALYDALICEGIAAEKFTQRYVVCIVTPDNTPDEIDRLRDALIKVLG